MLKSDDYQVGQLVTVIQGRKVETTTLTPYGPIEGEREDTSFNGVVMRIKAVNRPYIVVELLKTITGQDPAIKTLVLDTRENMYKLGAVSEEYARALGVEFPPKLILVN